MKTFLLAEKWNITENGVYFRLRKMGLSLDNAKVLSFEEIDGLYKRLKSWRMVSDNVIYHIYPPNRPSFSVSFATKDINELKNIITSFSKSYYTRREHWFSVTQYADHTIIKTARGEFVYYGENWKDIFNLAKKIQSGKIIIEPKLSVDEKITSIVDMATKKTKEGKNV